MHVALISPNRKIGGVQSRQLLLSRFLTKCGHKTTVAYTSENLLVNKEIYLADVVICTSGRELLNILLIKSAVRWRKNIKIIIVFAAPLLLMSYPLKRRLLHRMLIKLLSFTEVCAVSRDIVNNLVGAGVKNVHLLHDPIQSSYLNYLTSNPTTKLPRLPKVLWIGRNSDQKNIQYLNSITEYFMQQKSDIHFTIVTDDYNGIQRRENVNLMHFVNLDPNFYSHYDILLSSSKYEGFPNVVIEALLSGLLVFYPKNIIGYSDVCEHQNAIPYIGPVDLLEQISHYEEQGFEFDLRVLKDKVDEQNVLKNYLHVINK